MNNKIDISSIFGDDLSGRKGYRGSTFPEPHRNQVSHRPFVANNFVCTLHFILATPLIYLIYITVFFSASGIFCNARDITLVILKYL